MVFYPVPLFKYLLAALVRKLGNNFNIAPSFGIWISIVRSALGNAANKYHLGVGPFQTRQINAMHAITDKMGHVAVGFNGLLHHRRKQAYHAFLAFYFHINKAIQAK